MGRCRKCAHRSRKRWGAEYKVVEGEAAFYGPKIDIRVEDALGRNWQLTTVQLDYNQPENFDMTYIDEHGNKIPQAVIHAALLGSVDRFMGILIEHFAGAFPTGSRPCRRRFCRSAKNLMGMGKPCKSCATLPQASV